MTSPPDGDDRPVRGTSRPRRLKPWMLPVLIFAVVPAILVPLLVVLHRHHADADAAKADRIRQYALPFTGLHVPHGVAVDDAGNVYISDVRANRVLKLAAGTNEQSVLPFSGIDLSAGVVNESTAGIAVDRVGAVYVVDTGHNRVLRLAAGSTQQTVLPFSGVDFPQGVAVDAAGNVYVADEHHARVMKMPAGSSTQTALPSTGRHVTPHDLAVDTGGTLYVRASVSCGRRNCSELLKLAPGSDKWVTVPLPGTDEYVAVDTAGTVYVIALGDSGGVMALPAGSQIWSALPYRFVDPQGVAVDSRGHLYVTDHTGDRAPGDLFGRWEVMKDNSVGYVLKLPVN
jgi:DNA-binding beta-propeller fold protein YncE